MAKKNNQQADNLQDLESALTRTEQFIEDNSKIISYIIGGIVVVIAVFLGVKKFYIQPREKDAQSQMYMAEQYFEKDSFNLAINGDVNYPGFLDIIDKYGVTKAANLAHYYTGISYLHLGQFEEAVDYLKKFETDDIVLGPITAGALGDAYTELGNQSKALDEYTKAYTLNKNEFTTPIYMQKAGALLESMGKLEKALDIFNALKKEFPNTIEGRSADKYISSIELKLKK